MTGRTDMPYITLRASYGEYRVSAVEYIDKDHESLTKTHKLPHFPAHSLNQSCFSALHEIPPHV